MSTKDLHQVTEAESMKVAEASREKEWKQPSFLREMFLGTFRLDLIYPFPFQGEERPEFTAFYRAFKEFITDQVDPVEIDATGEYPEHVVDGLRKLGAFGMKIPKKYGGLGFTNVEYQKVMQLLGSVDGNLIGAALGAPVDRRAAAGEAVRLRVAEAEVPAALRRGRDLRLRAHRAAGGLRPGAAADLGARRRRRVHYILNGEKLWCTNGTLAELLVVMARDPKSKAISAFVVEMSWPGVEVEHRCHFMGLRALANGVISFENVRVPAENLIGDEGRGLKIALATLNTGRLTLPATARVGSAKLCLDICRQWAEERVQWGQPIGKHEAIAHKLADMAATTYAMESIADLAAGWRTAAATTSASRRRPQGVEHRARLGDRRRHACRSAAAAATRPSARSPPAARIPIGVERLMRDCRINRIFEGSSEIMHLFIAREAVDKHLQVAGALIDPEKPAAEKLGELPQIAAFYGTWYPSRWLGWGRWPRFAEFGDLAPHLRFVDRSSRRLARQIFHGMVVHQGKLQNKQGFLFRLVDIANELFAMAASVARAQSMADRGDSAAGAARELADLFCRDTRRKVNQLFRLLWSNDDAFKYCVGQRVLSGQHEWLESGILKPAEHHQPARAFGSADAEAKPVAVPLAKPRPVASS